MSLAVSGLAHRATPTVNGNFVVVQVAGTGAHRPLITDIRALLTAITQDYPSTPLGLLIGNTSGATMYIRTANAGGVASTLGIPIASDQSLYLPIEGIGDNVEFLAIVATSISVAVFF